LHGLKASYGAKFPKPSQRSPTEELLGFHEYPAEHWIHLRTTNPIESTFAAVRHRTKVTRGPGSRATVTSSENDKTSQFFIDGKQFSHHQVDTAVRFGAVEEWTIKNDSTEQHPFHIHINDFSPLTSLQR
jgi:FtsP/CotA-like multicopper oxidase with cupredoxin domain